MGMRKRTSAVTVRTLIREMLLLEGRLDDIKAKYPEHEQIVDHLAENDPSGNYKYLGWMARQAIELQEPVEEVIGVIEGFEQNKNRLPQKDLSRYNNLVDLRNALESLGGQSKSAQRRAVSGQAETVYDDGRYFVVHPKTREASQKYGAGSRWCIAATQSHNYFDNYTGRGNVFYFLIDREGRAGDSHAKVALQFDDPRNLTIWNASDKTEQASTTRTFFPIFDEALDAAKHHLKTKIDSGPAGIAKNTEDPDEFLKLVKRSNDLTVLQNLAKNSKPDMKDPEAMYWALSELKKKPELPESMRDQVGIRFTKLSFIVVTDLNAELATDDSRWRDLRVYEFTDEERADLINTGRVRADIVRDRLLNDIMTNGWMMFGGGKYGRELTGPMGWLQALPTDYRLEILQTTQENNPSLLADFYKNTRNDTFRSEILSVADLNTQLIIMVDTAEAPPDKLSLLIANVDDLLKRFAESKDRTRFNNLLQILTQKAPKELLQRRTLIQQLTRTMKTSVTETQ